MNLLNILTTHFEHGHFPVFFGAVTGIISVIPLLYYFASVAWTFFNKLHQINGLRKYRVFLMLVMLSIISADSLLIYYYVFTFFSQDTNQVLIPPHFIIINSLGSLLLAGLSTFLFKHASKRHDIDIFIPKGGKK